MLGVNVIGLNTYYAGLRREQQLYYFLLGNGATRNEAIAPFVRQALIKAFSPGIANMAVTGLVALPGTMIGQILGGSSPHVAIFWPHGNHSTVMAGCYGFIRIPNGSRGLILALYTFYIFLSIK